MKRGITPLNFSPRVTRNSDTGKTKTSSAKPSQSSQSREETPRETTSVVPNSPDSGRETHRETQLIMAKHISLEMFRGDDSQNSSQWLDKFVKYSTFHGFDNGKRLSSFQFYLTSHAEQWYMDLGEETKNDWDQLKQAFQVRFPQDSNFLDFQLSGITQQQGESVLDFFQRARVMTATKQMDDRMMFVLLSQGLRPDLKSFVMQRQPKTLDELRQSAQLAEKTNQLNMSTLAVAELNNYQSLKDEITELKHMLVSQSVNAAQNIDSRQPRNYENKNQRYGNNYQQNGDNTCSRCGFMCFQGVLCNLGGCPSLICIWLTCISLVVGSTDKNMLRPCFHKRKI